MGFEFFGQDEESIDKSQSLYSSFAKMEVRHKEYERARVIYKVSLPFLFRAQQLMRCVRQFALDRLPRARSAQLYASYTNFEKQFGSRTSIESTVLGKRRLQYEEELSHSSLNYDVWFDYTRLEEDAFKSVLLAGGTEGEIAVARERVEEIYERAVANVPPGDEKRHWRRYVFVWLNYALFEEMVTKVRFSPFPLVLPLDWRRSAIELPLQVRELISLRNRTSTERTKSTEHSSSFFRTRNSLSRKSGSNSPNSKFVRSLSTKRGRSWVSLSDSDRRRRSSRIISSWNCA